MPPSHALVATTSRQYAVALSRAFAGAALFSLPLLMTMEMWWLGHDMRPWKIIQFSLANMLLLYGLSKVAGFEESQNWVDDVLDAFAAYGVAAVTGAAVLWLMGVIGPGQPIGEIAGKIAVQTIPASFGAMIGAKLLGEGDAIEAEECWRRTYSGELFLMAAGALFFSFTMAPTEEIILIAFQITPAQALVTIASSVIVLHAILYLVHFQGQEQRRDNRGHGVGLFRTTLPGYAIAISVSLYILWTFGRIEGLNAMPAAMAAVVLGFPAAIGAGIARIVV